LRERFEKLTLREREVMGHVVTGRLNKQVANDMGISHDDSQDPSRTSHAQDEGEFAARSRAHGGQTARGEAHSKETGPTKELITIPAGAIAAHRRPHYIFAHVVALDGSSRIEAMNTELTRGETIIRSGALEADIPFWPPYDLETQRTMILDRTPHVSKDITKFEREVWAAT
jgi:hypothetical protein